MTINPNLRPISEATHSHGPIILYSPDVSPMWSPEVNASIELGWVGNGMTPGVHTARFGFFDFAGQRGPGGFRWTHFLRVQSFTT